MPLDFLLRVFRDDTQPIERQLEAAKAAAPYCHPKLTAIEHSAVEDEEKVTEIRVSFVKPIPRPD